MAKHKKSRRLLLFLLTTLILGTNFLLFLGIASNYIPPRRIWWIPFTGFVFPYVYLLGILLAVACVKVSKKLFFLHAILLLICLPYAYRFFPVNFINSSEKHSESTFSIMSYNVRHFDRHRILNQGDTTKMKIFDFLQSEQPDILCFQEYYKGRKKDPFVNATKIQAIGNYDYRVENTIFETVEYNFGVSIYSKYPIVNHGVVTAPSAKFFFNVYADILLTTNDTIRVFNTHFESIRLTDESYSLFESPSWNIEEQKSPIKNTVKKIKSAFIPREVQVNAIIKAALASPYPVFIVGDFNDPPMSFTYQRFKQHFQDHFTKSYFGRGATYVGKIPAGRIDYIFSSTESIIPRGFSIQKEILSDHRAIKAYFELLSD